MMFLNLPVKDLRLSKAFFTRLGFEFSPEFVDDDSCACLVVDKNIFVMLLTEQRFRDFVNGEIADALTTEMLVCLSADSRECVDATVATAIAAGGKPWKPTFEHGPMYGGSFQDPDGHVWELMHMAEA